MLVKFLKPHPAFAYFEGDNADISPEAVQELIQSGHVILFPGVEKEPKPAKKYNPQVR